MAQKKAYEDMTVATLQRKARKRGLTIVKKDGTKRTKAGLIKKLRK